MAYVVMRQDDHGNRFTVREGLDKEEADRLAEAFMARGHKQLYWAEVRHVESLLLIKPGAYKRQLTDAIFSRVTDSGLIIIDPHLVQPSDALILAHYEESIRKHGDFLAQRLLTYFRSAPTLAARVAGDNSVARLRDLCGASSDPAQCRPGTIRADYGLDSLAVAMSEGRCVDNLVHSSESVDDAKREISLWYQTALFSRE